MDNISFSIVGAQHQQQWDDYVQTHALATPYHRFAWLQAVQTAYSQKMAGVMAMRDNTVVGVFPATLFSVPIRGKHLCALPYCDIGYALADSPDIHKAMQDYLLKQFAGQIQHLEVRALSQTPMDEQALTGQKVRMVLPLPESSDALMASFKSKLRSQIRKAEKNGLTVTVATTPEQIHAFYSVYSKNMRDLGSPVHHIRWFNAVIAHYADNAVLSVVYFNNEPIGAGIVLKNASKACIPWASTLREHNHLAPNMLLYWSLLEHCADNGIEEFDFGRSTFEEGTYRFKKQWGATPQLLVWQTFNPDGEAQPYSGAAASTSSLREMVENTWQKLPLGVTVKLGAMIRPFISL